MPRGTPSTSSAPSKFFEDWKIYELYEKKFFEEDEAEEATKKSSSKYCTGYTYFVQLNWLWKVEFLSQPISKYRNRMTTLIPFLRAIWKFCNFIHSYFMDRFAFLIELTSYLYVSPLIWYNAMGHFTFLLTLHNIQISFWSKITGVDHEKPVIKN